MSSSMLPSKAGSTVAGAREANGEGGLLGGIFSRQGHGGIHVKFSDVDWATLVRMGGFLSQQEVQCYGIGTWKHMPAWDGTAERTSS